MRCIFLLNLSIFVLSNAREYTEYMLSVIWERRDRESKGERVRDGGEGRGGQRKQAYHAT